MANIEIPHMTMRQTDWIIELLTDASDKALGFARNNHVFALGSNSQEEAVEFEKAADEQREYAKILLEIAKSIDAAF